ncbi:hypothetical protein ACE6H2_026034 [Prunus campanulata]
MVELLEITRTISKRLKEVLEVNNGSRGFLDGGTKSACFRAYFLVCLTFCLGGWLIARTWRSNCSPLQSPRHVYKEEDARAAEERLSSPRDWSLFSKG